MTSPKVSLEYRLNERQPMTKGWAIELAKGEFLATIDITFLDDYDLTRREEELLKAALSRVPKVDFVSPPVPYRKDSSLFVTGRVRTRKQYKSLVHEVTMLLVHCLNVEVVESIDKTGKP